MIYVCTIVWSEPGTENIFAFCFQLKYFLLAPLINHHYFCFSHTPPPRPNMFSTIFFLFINFAFWFLLGKQEIFLLLTKWLKAKIQSLRLKDTIKYNKRLIQKKKKNNKQTFIWLTIKMKLNKVQSSTIQSLIDTNIHTMQYMCTYIYIGEKVRYKGLKKEEETKVVRGRGGDKNARRK